MDDRNDWIVVATTVLCLVVAVSAYYALVDQRKFSTSTLNGETLFTKPSFFVVNNNNNVTGGGSDSNQQQEQDNDDESEIMVSFGKNWTRRRQTLAMFSCSLSFIMPAVLVCLGSFIYGVYWCFNNKHYATGMVLGIYLLYCWFLDMAPTYGDRSPWLRGGTTRSATAAAATATTTSTFSSYLSSWWDHACDYLPLLLVKTADLPAYSYDNDDNDDDDADADDKENKKRRKPNKYVLGYHPHGIIAVGAFCAFATDSARVLDLSKSRFRKNKMTKENDNDGNDEDWIKAALREAADDFEENEEDKEEDEEKSKQSTMAKNVRGLMKGSMMKHDNDGDDDDYDTTTSAKKATAASPSSRGVVPRGFSTLFPQLDRRVVTLPQNFWTPLVREYFLSMGAVTSDRDTFRRYLSSQHPGALIVVVGGAAESMVANTGTINLVLEKRRGFVREAIHANASLVPVLGFGETDLYQLYDTKDDPTLVKIQAFVKATFGFAMPFFKGRDMFLKKIGVMPQRTPVVVVVGKPIPPPTRSELGNKPHHKFDPKVDRQNDKALNGDGKILMEWHSRYVKSLNELYQEYKDAKWNMPGQSRTKSLRIVR